MKQLCYHILYFNMVAGLIIYLLVMTHGDQFSTEIQALFMGGNSCIFTIVILIFNVNYVVSCIWSILYIPTVILLQKKFQNYDQDLLTMFVFQAFPIMILLIFYSYVLERDSKLKFLQNKQIVSLLKEQKKLFDLLPDGLVIH